MSDNEEDYDAILIAARIFAVLTLLYFTVAATSIMMFR